VNNIGSYYYLGSMLRKRRLFLNVQYLEAHIGLAAKALSTTFDEIRRDIGEQVFGDGIGGPRRRAAAAAPLPAPISEEESEERRRGAELTHPKADVRGMSERRRAGRQRAEHAARSAQRYRVVASNRPRVTR
jgi:hypothetical protein